MSVKTKRIYENYSKDDGYRVLIDHIWPRGIKKETAKLDDWIKEIAPSGDLRKWYGHDKDKFNEFKKRYRKELDANTAAVEKLQEAIKAHETVTLLYAAKASDISNAAVLADYLRK